MRILPGFLLLAGLLGESPEIRKRAEQLYQRTDYKGSLQVLAGDSAPTAAGYALAGKNYFKLGDYKKAAEFFEKALSSSPNSSDYELWLGRTFGRRAETGNWVLAPGNASKARKCFEKAVELDPHNAEAMNDLFDFYLNAPEFLGGGMDKAEAIARRIANERPAESHFELAQLADRRKQHAEAEAHLRQAMDAAPGQVGRVLDLARYLAKQGRFEEGEALFARANTLAPNDPRVIFAEAKTYIDAGRDIEKARRLLRQYLASDLTPDDTPKQVAEKLLRQVSGG
jgi:tetratricopeptide (TPR) repeat protein